MKYLFLALTICGNYWCSTNSIFASGASKPTVSITLEQAKMVAEKKISVYGLEFQQSVQAARLIFGGKHKAYEREFEHVPSEEKKRIAFLEEGMTKVVVQLVRLHRMREPSSRPKKRTDELINECLRWQKRNPPKQPLDCLKIELAHLYLMKAKSCDEKEEKLENMEKAYNLFSEMNRNHISGRQFKYPLVYMAEVIKLGFIPDDLKSTDAANSRANDLISDYLESSEGPKKSKKRRRKSTDLKEYQADPECDEDSDEEESGEDLDVNQIYRKNKKDINLARKLSGQDATVLDLIDDLSDDETTETPTADDSEEFFFIEDRSDYIRPTPKEKYYTHGDKRFQFHKTSTKEHSCAFYSQGLGRKEGANRLLRNLGNDTVRRFIGTQIRHALESHDPESEDEGLLPEDLEPYESPTYYINCKIGKNNELDGEARELFELLESRLKIRPSSLDEALASSITKGEKAYSQEIQTIQEMSAKLDKIISEECRKKEIVEKYIRQWVAIPYKTPYVTIDQTDSVLNAIAYTAGHSLKVYKKISDSENALELKYQWDHPNPEAPTRHLFHDGDAKFVGHFSLLTPTEDEPKRDFKDTSDHESSGAKIDHLKRKKVKNPRPAISIKDQVLRLYQENPKLTIAEVMKRTGSKNKSYITKIRRKMGVAKKMLTPKEHEKQDEMTLAIRSQLKLREITPTFPRILAEAPPGFYRNEKAVFSSHQRLGIRNRILSSDLNEGKDLTIQRLEDDPTETAPNIYKYLKGLNLNISLSSVYRWKNSFEGKEPKKRAR